jgi:hypothetical protein
MGMAERKKIAETSVPAVQDIQCRASMKGLQDTL